MEPHLVVAGLVGSTFEAISAAAHEEGLPFLQECIEKGRHAELRSSEPASLAASWITIVTGRRPSEHGIFDLFRLQSAGGHQLSALSSRDLECDAVWTLLDREGKRSTIVDVPLTVPPPRVAGFVLSGSWATTRQLRYGCHPSDLLKQLADEGIAQAADFGREAFAGDASDHEGIEAWIAAEIKREAAVFDTLLWLAGKDPSSLTMFLCRGLGCVLSWRRLSVRHRELCEPYLRALDKSLADLLRSSGPNANLLLLSEPGAGLSGRTLHLNAWLHSQGELQWTGNAGPAALDHRVIDSSYLNALSKLVDWSKTRAWSPLTGSAAIYIVRADTVHPHGVQEDEYATYREQLAEKLSAVSDVRRVWKREELYSGSFRDIAPDLIIECEPGVAISPLASATELQVTDEEVDGSGLLLGVGPLFGKGSQRVSIDLLDVAPLLLYGSASAVPSDLEGRVPIEFIAPSWLAAHPVQAGPSASERPPDAPMLDPGAEEEVLQRLRALGYVE